MKETDVQQILGALRQAYPEYEITPHLSRQKRGKCLLVIKGLDFAGDIDDWSVAVAHVLVDMVTFLEQQGDALARVRLMFVRENWFVLHSPDVGQRTVFRKMEKPIKYDCYGGYEFQHYVGECQNIEDVLEYLTTTAVWF